MDAPALVLINGQPASTVPVTDRGLQYGDGLFETMRLHQGRIPLWPLHLARLRAGADRLGLALNGDLLEASLRQACDTTDQGTLKLCLTRGDTGRGYGYPAGQASRLILYLYPANSVAPQPGGIRVRLCQTQLARQPTLAGLKHLNRLEQVLARAEWQPPAFQEGLVCDTDGWLIEGTFSNLFLYRDGELLTPKLDMAGVAGVLRQHLITQQPLGLPVRETRLRPDDLHSAQSCFLTNALIGLWPVAEVVLPSGPLRLPDVTMPRRIYQTLVSELGFAAN